MTRQAISARPYRAGAEASSSGHASNGAVPESVPGVNRFSADDIAAATGQVPVDPAAAIAADAESAAAAAESAATDVDENTELPPDTIGPMPEWMYPRQGP